MDDFETRLQRELQRVAGEARGPAPRAAQARYRQARPSILVVSKLAVGTATIAIALSASVVAAAAFSGSRPTDWGHAVKVVVDRCQIEQNDPGSQIGPCVSSFVPSGLPLLPTIHSGETTQSGGGHSGNTAGAASANSRTRSTQAAGVRPTPTAEVTPSQLPIVTGQPATVAGAPTPAPSAVAVATPLPSPSATPVSTPTPTPTPAPTPTPTPVPTPSPSTVPSTSGTIPDVSPSPRP
jgi:hypothetical protein